MPPSRPLRSWSLFLLACKWSVYAALRVCLLGKSVPVIASSVVLRTYTNVCGIIILERAIFLHLFRLFPCVVCGWSRPVTNRHLFWQPVTDRVYWTCMGKGHLLHVLVVLSSFFLFRFYWSLAAEYRKLLPVSLVYFTPCVYHNIHVSPNSCWPHYYRMGDFVDVHIPRIH